MTLRLVLALAFLTVESYAKIKSELDASLIEFGFREIEIQDFLVTIEMG